MSLRVGLLCCLPIHVFKLGPTPQAVSALYLQERFKERRGAGSAFMGWHVMLLHHTGEAAPSASAGFTSVRLLAPPPPALAPTIRQLPPHGLPPLTWHQLRPGTWPAPGKKKERKRQKGETRQALVARLPAPPAEHARLAAEALPTPQRPTRHPHVGAPACSSTPTCFPTQPPTHHNPSPLPPSLPPPPTHSPLPPAAVGA